MIGNKGIRILCNIIIGISYIVGLLIIIFGVDRISNSNNLIGAILIVSGIAYPFASMLLLFPVFALSKIDESLQSIDEKMDLVIDKDPLYANDFLVTQFKKKLKEESYACDEEDLSRQNPYISQDIKNGMRKGNMPGTNPCTLENLMNFINERYGIALCPSDDISSIKHKIMSIGDTSYSASVLKEKINQSETIGQIIDAFEMHKAIYQ